MKQLVIADLDKCGQCSLDDQPPCVKAWENWGDLGKACHVDADDPEDSELVKGTTAAYIACTRGAIQYKRA